MFVSFSLYGLLIPVPHKGQELQVAEFGVDGQSGNCLVHVSCFNGFLVVYLTFLWLGALPINGIQKRTPLYNLCASGFNKCAIWNFCAKPVSA
jgi:hypothetical protein